MIGKNNPLNIRTSTAFTWAGQTGSTRGFCDFEDVEWCRRAGAYLLMRSYRRAHCNTVGAVICRWAPSSENETDSYIHFVCKTTGFKAETKLCFDSDFAAILAAMEILEKGVPVNLRAEYYETAKHAYLKVIIYFNIKRYED